jgi:hypothetical protein
MDPVLITQDGANVKISWNIADGNNGTIDKYRITIQTTAPGIFSEDPTCDGSNATIFGQLWCTIPMANLRASPFNLAFRKLIEARVEANNEYGWGPTSGLNLTGVSI